MKRVQAAIDIQISIIIWISVAIISASPFLVEKQDMLILLLCSVPIISLLLWIYFGSWYELREEYLFCRYGPFCEKIYYDKIKALRLSNNLFSSMALSSKRIEIRQHGKGYIIGTTFISPVDREGFLDELAEQCKNLENQP